MPVWQLLGGKVRDKVKVYGWIGGDTPQAVVEGATLRKQQGFTAVKMNGTGTYSALCIDISINHNVRLIGLD